MKKVGKQNKKKSPFTVEKADKHYLGQMIKVNIKTDNSGW